MELLEDALLMAHGKIVEHRNPLIGKFIKVDGATLHYVERGSGSLLLFLHDNATMLQDFMLTDAIASAAEGHRAPVLDRPDFGYGNRPGARTWSASEQADLLAEVLCHLNCNQTVVVGHSWGTLVAVALAERHPALVRSLVLLPGYYSSWGDLVECPSRQVFN